MYLSRWGTEAISEKKAKTTAVSLDNFSKSGTLYCSTYCCLSLPTGGTYSLVYARRRAGRALPRTSMNIAAANPGRPFFSPSSPARRDFAGKFTNDYDHA